MFQSRVTEYRRKLSLVCSIVRVLSSGHEGSISLAVVGRRAVQAGDFVDGVGGKVRRSSLGLGEVK